MKKAVGTLSFIVIMVLCCVILVGCNSGKEGEYTGSIKTIAVSETQIRLGGWSPDGKWIVYTEKTGEKEFGVAKVNIETEEVVNLLKTSETAGSAAWSPKGDLIAYSLSGDIWTMNTDGTEKKQLTKNKELREDVTWGLDGDRIYVLHGPASELLISEVNVQTGEIKKVFSTDYPLPAGLGRQRPNGGILGWTWGAKGFWLCEIDVAKNELHDIISQTLLVNRKDEELWLTYPDSSPDGRFIVYQEGKYAQGGIQLVKPDGSGKATIISDVTILNGNRNLGASKPMWSPKYDVIAFTVYPYNPEKVTYGIALFRFDEASLAKLRSGGV